MFYLFFLWTKFPNIFPLAGHILVCTLLLREEALPVAEIKQDVDDLIFSGDMVQPISDR